MSRRLGTAARLSAYFALLLGIVLGTSAWCSWYFFSHQLQSEATARLNAEIASYTKAAQASAPTNLSNWTLHYLSSTVLPSGTTLIVAFTNGPRLASAGAKDLVTSSSASQDFGPANEPSSVRDVEIGTKNLQVVSAPIMQGATQIGMIYATYDLARLEQEETKALVVIVVESAVGLIAAVVGSYLLLRQLLRKIGYITHTARSIEEGEISARLGDQGTDDEVGELAETFDEMLDRIADAMTLQRQLLADVSHQLRTPLTVMQGHLELLERGGYDDQQQVASTVEVVMAELEHTRILSEQLLLLGHVLERDFLDAGPVDLRSLIGDLVVSTASVVEPTLEIGDVPDVVIDADFAKLRGALANLIDNAVHAAGPAGTVEVSGHILPDGRLALDIDDSGPGIPFHERARVLDRYNRRLGESREGSGIGLSIVVAIAEAHGGTVELSDSPLGGLRARIALPHSLLIGADQLED